MAIELVPPPVEAPSALRIVMYSTVKESASDPTMAIEPPRMIDEPSPGGRDHVAGSYPPCTLTLDRSVMLSPYVPAATYTSPQPWAKTLSIPAWRE
jgi:hypothetical protein